MPTKDNLHAKAIYESILYYLRERIEHKNNDVKHIIITNLYEWFVFDARQYEKQFYQNTKLVKEYEEWKQGQKTSGNTDLFYKEIAAKYLPNDNIEFIYFDILNYDTQKGSNELNTDKKLTALYKFFSPGHLLKKPFANDSNSLNKPFYYELLYILGLEEHKVKGRKLISRPPEGKRINGSMIENTITTIQSRNRLQHLNSIYKYGQTETGQLEAVALEVNINWLNRILFLKLLEAQLLRYHNGDKQYRFLSFDKIYEYDMLEELFFDVLAVPEDLRNPYSKENFGHIPYLNSSLFEQTELENHVVSMSMLKDRFKIPLYKNTVLKDASGKKQQGEMSILEYLFAFLDAYDFASEGREEVQKHGKELINASVLGLIFEKINGYKEGSFFTPGFITQYMARETIRRAVVQKFMDASTDKNLSGFNQVDFKQLEGLQFVKSFDDVKFFMKRFLNLKNIKLFNSIINSLKIVDPAVGSGHFLVSVLNEILAIKSELGLLADEKGMPLDYSVIVENDGLIIKHKQTGEDFEYQLDSKGQIIAGLQPAQETLFKEKRKIIENCLFGVDINPNSVNITRLRLWIELLKNAYYKVPDKNPAGFENLPGIPVYKLETLPNIDINIKTGNSLISRFPLDADIKKALRGTKWNMFSYLNAVKAYKSTYDKKAKDEIRKLISDIKNNFRTELSARDPRYQKLAKLKNKFYDLFSTNVLFEPETVYGKNRLEESKREAKKNKMQKDIDKLAAEVEEIKNSKIFYNAFEWRFEFPEVLDENGKFLGFDVVIGNPPYIRQEMFSEIKPYLKNKFKIYHSIADLLTYFVEQSYFILKEKGIFQFIISNKFTRTDYGKIMRNFLLQNTSLTHFVDFSGLPVFDEATVDAAVLGYIKQKTKNNHLIYADIKKEEFIEEKFLRYITENSTTYEQNNLNENSWAFEKPEVIKIKQKVEKLGVPLKDWDITINYGIKTGYNEAFIIDSKTKDKLIAEDPKSAEILKPVLRGRDIQKYYPDFQDLWLIATFPSRDYNIDDYPTIRNYLKSFGKRLEQNGEKGSRKKTSNKWFETQDNIAYWQDFEKPKIIYPNMTKFLPFVLDIEEHYYHNDKAFHITGKQIYWLAAFLNSKLFKYCFKNNFAELLGGTRELRKVFFEPIPVKQIMTEEELPFKDKVRQIIAMKKKNPKADTSTLENKIDQMVYRLYGLTKEEIKIVASSVF